LGNEQGIQVTFTCRTTVIDVPTTRAAVVSGCRLQRNESGTFILTVTGLDFQRGLTVTVGGVTPRKVRFRDASSEAGFFTRLELKGRVCRGLPGAIVVVNPGGARPSTPFQCNFSCPAQQ
jgi:hypothetical protein